MRKKNICVTRLDKDKVAYLFFKIFIKQTKIVHLYSKRSSFINHSAVFAILFIVKFSDFTTQQHGRRSLAGVCRQLSARPPNIKGVSLLVRFPILCHGYTEISLKIGIEPRFSLGVFKCTVKLHVLLGKLRNFMEFSHGIVRYGLIQFHMDKFLDVFHEKTK